jgi:hypothetical protein
MVTTMKKVRFNEQVTVLYVPAAEQAWDSHFDSNINHECHEEEDAAAINIDFSNELPYLSVLPTAVESTTSINLLNYMYCSRWVMSNNKIHDIPPILPFRKSNDPVHTIISSALSIIDRPQDLLPPSKEYIVERARAA